MHRNQGDVLKRLDDICSALERLEMIFLELPKRLERHQYQWLEFRRDVKGRLATIEGHVRALLRPRS